MALTQAKIYRQIIIGFVLCIMLSITMFAAIYYKSSTVFVVQDTDSSLSITFVNDSTIIADTMSPQVSYAAMCLNCTTKQSESPSISPTTTTTKSPTNNTLSSRPVAIRSHNNTRKPSSHTIITKNISNNITLRPLFFTVVNKGYEQLTFNWVLNLEDVGMTDYYVLCIGVKCYRRMRAFMKQHRFRTMHIRQANISQYTEEKLARGLIFASKEYWTFIWVRARLIRDLYLELFDKFINVRRHKYNAIFFMDGDVAMIKNWVPILQDRYLYDENNNVYDIVLSVDCNKYGCDVKTAGSGGYCACYIFMPFSVDNHQRHLDLFERWIDRLDGKLYVYINNAHRRRKRNVNDQRALNEALDDMESINIGVLSRFQWPSGWLLRDEDFRAVVETSIVAIHANYVVGPRSFREKSKTFRAYNRWLLPWEFNKDPLPDKYKAIVDRNTTKAGE